MKTGISLLTVFSLALTPVPVWGTEVDEAESEVPEQGYLTFSDAYDGGNQEIYVEVIDGEIFADAESIAGICGAEVTEENGQTIFDRNGYQVRVNLSAGTAMLYNQVQEISGQLFSLPNYEGTEGERLFPLEKTMYLLNMGWQIVGDTVLAEKPADTFWNTLNDYETLLQERPLNSDLVGDGFLEQLGNSAKYTFWAMADDLDYRLFIPFGDQVIESDRCMDALYSLGYSDAEVLEGDVSETLETQLENLAGMMRGGYENMAPLTEIPENVSDFGAYVADQIGKPFNRWETLQDPNVSQLMTANKEFSDKADALTWISAALNVAGAVSRVEQWSDSYVGQLQTLGEADTDRFTSGKDKARRITRVAQEAYENSQSIPAAVTKGVVRELGDMVGTELLELTPVGKVLNIYDVAVELVSTESPEIQAGLEMGEDAYEGRMMIDISTVATYHCAELLNALTAGNDLDEESLQEARNAYLLLVRTYTRAWDKLIQVKDQEGYRYEGEKEELEALRLQGYALSVRLNESAQFDNTLMLEEDFGNLYHEDIETGGLREEIPLSLIHEKVVFDTALPAGDVAQAADGTIYYWEYHAGSFEAEAPLAYYQPVVGAVNRLMERKPAGETSVVVETEGSGSLALTDEAIFFERPIDTMSHTEIFRLNLSDHSIESLGEGKLQAAAGEAVICSDNNETQLDCILPEDGTRKKIADGSFLAAYEGKIYYQPQEADTDAAAKGQVTLAVVNPVGSDPQTLCTTAPDVSDGTMNSSAAISHMVFHRDDIYFSYGAYGGTALDFLGGRIMRVKKDGSQAEVAAGSEELQGAIFSVQDDGTVVSQSIDEVDTMISPMDTYYTRDGNIYFFDENGAPEALVGQSDYSSVADIPCGQIALQGNSLSVSFAQKVGDCIYMQMDYGEATAGSMGWRTNMAWIRSALLCKNLTTGETETIYTF